MGGSGSTSQQVQEKQLIMKLDSENIPSCREHPEEKYVFVCTEEKCKNKMELFCRICNSKQRDYPHRSHRVQSVKEILLDILSSFKRLDTVGAGSNVNSIGTYPNRSMSIVTNNILGTHVQGIQNDSDIEDSFKKLASDFMILSQNCKDLSEMIMQCLLQAKEDSKKVDLEFTRPQTKKIMVDIANTCQQQNIGAYSTNVKKLEGFLKFDGMKAKFIDNDGTLRKQFKKGTTEWLNRIWDEMKKMTEAVSNIRQIGHLLPAMDLINSMQKKNISQQNEYQLKEYLKQQSILQQQQQQQFDDFEDQNQFDTQKKQDIEEFIHRSRQQQDEYEQGRQYQDEYRQGRQYQDENKQGRQQQDEYRQGRQYQDGYRQGRFEVGVGFLYFID